MDRSDVQRWADHLRALADRLELAEHGEEVIEVAAEAERLATDMRAPFPVAARRVG